MRPSSSPSIPLSSASKLPSASFYERYERIFQCEGGACITEDKDVSMYQYQQSRSDEATDEQQHNSNHQITTTEAIQQESPPPVVTVMYKHEASYNNDEDTFDIDEQRRTQSRTKAAQTEAANKEYFNNRIQQLQLLIHKSNDQSQSQIQTHMALPIISSPDTTTQQQQQQRHQQQQQCQCHSSTSIINSNKTYATRSPKKPKKSKPVHYEMCTVEMPRNFRLLKGQQYGGGSWKHTDASESTQSTQSMSESEGDDLSSLESHVGGSPDAEDTLVSILRRKVVKFGAKAETTTKATDNNRGRRVVRFEKDTQFPDPNERPSPKRRKHVPRMSPRQKQEYQRNHYDPPTTTVQRRRQVDLSSFLIQLFVQHRPL
mmetsp:Transcript_50841/g.57585  ORF Transcript_50841/g.57585 Transcript_50841/m.57585 type:complete len:373 (-) Transcript_50841:148-1266(-)